MVTNGQHSHRPRRYAAAVSVLLVVTGVILLIVAATSQRHPPQPPASAGIAYTAPSTGTVQAGSVSPSPAVPPGTGETPPGKAPAAVTGPLLARSIPTRLDIPAIGVASDLVQLGIGADSTVQVPPTSRDSRAGWYRYSPAPGQLGPAVILGHVDSAAYGPAVFFRLGALRPTNLINVTRADHRVAVFRVDRVVSYPKNHFPTLEVYGNTDHAALRLITCGGKFDFTNRSYLANIVVYASLIASHPA